MTNTLNSTHQSHGSEGIHYTRETLKPCNSDSEDKVLLRVSNTYTLQVKYTYCSSRNQRPMMVASSFSLNSRDAVNIAKTLHFTDLSFKLPEDPLVSDKERVQMMTHEVWKVTGFQFR